MSTSPKPRPTSPECAAEHRGRRACSYRVLNSHSPHWLGKWRGSTRKAPFCLVSSSRILAFHTQRTSQRLVQSQAASANNLSHAQRAKCRPRSPLVRVACAADLPAPPMTPLGRTSFARPVMPNFTMRCAYPARFLIRCQLDPHRCAPLQHGFGGALVDGVFEFRLSFGEWRRALLRLSCAYQGFLALLPVILFVTPHLDSCHAGALA